MAAEGGLHMQGYTYEEELRVRWRPTKLRPKATGNGNTVSRHVKKAKNAIAEILGPGPHSQAECELVIGPEPPAPVNLASVLTGADNATAPGVQNGTSVVKGEAFLVAAE